MHEQYIYQALFYSMALVTKLEIACGHHVSLHGQHAYMHVRIWNKLYVYKPACVDTLYSSHIRRYSVLDLQSS